MISGENSKMSVALCIDRESNPDRPRGRSQFRSLRLISFDSVFPIAVFNICVSGFHLPLILSNCKL